MDRYFLEKCCNYSQTIHAYGKHDSVKLAPEGIGTGQIINKQFMLRKDMT